MPILRDDRYDPRSSPRYGVAILRLMKTTFRETAAVPRKSKAPAGKFVPPKDETGTLKERFDRRYPQNLHKELWQFADKQPENSLYRWWWEFQRASRDYPSLRDELAKSATNASEIEAVERDFGELGDDFKVWWENQGASLFAEKGIPLITVPGSQDPNNIDFINKNGVLMIIPMTISRELIIDQLNVVLDVYHPKEKLRRHAHSSADRKIYPRQRYPETDYEVLIKIWREFRRNKIASAKRRLWEIYCDALDEPTLRQQLEMKTADAAAARIKISKVATKLYEQADELMKNAIQGHFPKDDAFQAKKGHKK